jgi:uncharacterized protein (TIGR00730 family)
MAKHRNNRKSFMPTKNKSLNGKDNSAGYNICVFCGSGKGRNAKYARAATSLGRAMARADIGLVYGGGSLGLMGEIARSVIANGGRVTGIIPEFLSKKEKMLTEVDELIVTDDMHERKQLMFNKSDAFVALPGGIGTLEELVEQLTWAQLGRHDKPIILANIGGFWDPLLSLLQHMREQAFIRRGLEVRFSVVERTAQIVPTVLAECPADVAHAAAAAPITKL